MHHSALFVASRLIHQTMKKVAALFKTFLTGFKRVAHRTAYTFAEYGKSSNAST
jgi:hypothetical protein